MRLGIISDTHGLLRPEVFAAFAEVDHILHAGDVGPLELLTELEALAPVTAVYGNTDGWDVRAKLPQVQRLRLDGFDIVVTHGDQLGSPTPAKLHAAFPPAEIIVFGHTHKPLIENLDCEDTDSIVTVVNPGSAGRRRFDLPISVAIMELEPGIPPRVRLDLLVDFDAD